MDQTILLDVDETLVHTFDDADDFHRLQPFKNKELFPVRSRIYHMKLIDVGEPIGSGDVWEMWGIERNDLITFLKYCFARFKYVIIWSAGQKRYVERLSERLFRWSDEPHLILHWDHCRQTEDMFDKPIKHLKKQFPQISDHISLKNTFIIDDKYDNFEIANLNNGIHIPPYSPDPEVDDMLKQDNVLQKLIEWFELPEVKNSKDVRTLPKSAIWK